jgi:hypothetical protein
MREVLCQENDLTAMIRIVANLPVNGLHHGMRLAPDGDCTPEVGVGERLERAEEATPTLIPKLHQRGARRWRIHKFRVTVAIRLLAVGRKKIRPAGPHIAGYVFYDDRDGIHFAVEHLKEVFVFHLLHGALRQFLVLAKKRQAILDIRSREFQSHETIILL